MLKKWYHNRIKKVVDERLDNLLNFQLRLYNFHEIDDRKEEDIYIVGYPKSGTTLMQHLVAHLYFGLNSNAEKLLINQLVIDIGSVKYYPRMSEKCFFKSHSLPNAQYKNVIYMVRDGRDANLSLWYMIKDILNKEKKLEDVFLKPTRFGTWNDHVIAWYNNPFKSNILFVKYEDFLENKLETIKLVNKFIGAKASIDEMEKVEKLISIEHMRSLEKTELGLQYKKLRNWNTESNFSRTGKSKNYIKEVPEEIIKKFNDYSKEAMTAFKYK